MSVRVNWITKRNRNRRFYRTTVVCVRYPSYKLLPITTILNENIIPVRRRIFYNCDTMSCKANSVGLLHFPPMCTDTVRSYYNFLLEKAEE